MTENFVEDKNKINNLFTYLFDAFVGRNLPRSNLTGVHLTMKKDHKFILFLAFIS